MAARHASSVPTTDHSLRLECTVPYRDGSRAGWFKVKDRSWYEREAWRFER